MVSIVLGTQHLNPTQKRLETTDESDDSSMKHRQAAFINAIADEGTKDEAVKFLQETWNELCEARAEIRQLKYRLEGNPSNNTVDEK